MSSQLAPVAADLASAVTPRRPRITDEDRRLLAMVAAGLTQREIGQRTGRRRTAVNNKLVRIYRLIGAVNGPNAVAIAIRNGLISAGGPARRP
jgi:DNA-binding CsgD family transcriptional regulator